jgi:hypothetical protein
MHGAPLSFEAVQKIAESRQVLTTSSTTQVGGYSEYQSTYALDDNYPNPFNPSTTISYSLPKSANVSLKIFNALGQEVAVLVNEQKPPGYYQVRWNANVPSGFYLYRLRAGEFVETKKMVLVR